MPGDLIYAFRVMRLPLLDAGGAPIGRIEDIVIVLSGRPAFLRELMEVPGELGQYIRYQMAQHLATVAHPRDRLRPGESIEEMLLRSLALDPLFYPSLDALLVYYEQVGANGQRYALLREVVMPRLVQIKFRDGERAWRYLAELEASAAANNDVETQQALVTLQASLGLVSEIARPYWLFDPGARN